MLSSRVNNVRLCVSQTRNFTAIPIPVGPRSPDNVYRRPNVPMPSAPLREDDEMIWFDGQSPETAFDRHNHYIKRSDALKQCLLMLTVVMGGVSFVASIVDPPGNRGVAPQDYPFNGLHQELGGDYTRRARQQQQQQQQ